MNLKNTCWESGTPHQRPFSSGKTTTTVPPVRRSFPALRAHLRRTNAFERVLREEGGSCDGFSRSRMAPMLWRWLLVPAKNLNGKLQTWRLAAEIATFNVKPLLEPPFTSSFLTKTHKAGLIAVVPTKKPPWMDFSRTFSTSRHGTSAGRSRGVGSAAAAAEGTHVDPWDLWSLGRRFRHHGLDGDGKHTAGVKWVKKKNARETIRHFFFDLEEEKETQVSKLVSVFWESTG